MDVNLPLTAHPAYSKFGFKKWPSNSLSLRVRFFKKIQDWIFKSERIRKRILRFFTRQINPRSLGSWRVKGTEESRGFFGSFDAP